MSSHSLLFINAALFVILITNQLRATAMTRFGKRFPSVSNDGICLYRLLSVKRWNGIEGNYLQSIDQSMKNHCRCRMRSSTLCSANKQPGNCIVRSGKKIPRPVDARERYKNRREVISEMVESKFQVVCIDRNANS